MKRQPGEKEGPVRHQPAVLGQGQDSLFVREDIGFIGRLIAHAPLELRYMLGEFIPALYSELDLFGSMAKELGVSREGIELSPIRYADKVFLLATVHTRSFAESFAVLSGSEKACSDSWSRVKKLHRQTSPYQRLIDRWDMALTGGEWPV
jgi:thiaminase